MKKKIIMLMIIVLTLGVSICYGKTNTYIINDSYMFNIGDDVYNDMYIKINIGDINISAYSMGEFSVSPPAYVIEEDRDENGKLRSSNKILKFNKYSFIGKENQPFVINVRKTVKTTDNKNGFLNPSLNPNLMTNAKLSMYVTPTTNVESNDPAIQAKALELTANCETTYDMIKNIFEFVNMYLVYDTSDVYRNKGALAALQTGRGVCEEYSTLFAALCRAVNIPVRIITGYNAEVLVPNVEKDSTQIYHAWPEVYVEGVGWVPCEVTAEYYLNGNKQPYWKGFLSLPDPSLYVVEGEYVKELNEIEWYGLTFDTYEKTIVLEDTVYFEDIENHWSKNHVEKLYDDKIINGYNDGTFKPQNNVSRIEYICMLARVLSNLNMYYYGIDEIYYPQDFVSNWSKENYDSLMKYLAFYAKDYESGAGFNTINYIFGDTLKMDEPILREEVVALLAVFLKDPNDGIIVDINDGDPNSDINGITTFYEEKEMLLTDIEESKFKKEIILSYNNNIIVGYDDNTFKPTQTITRGEIATIFDRIINKEK